MQWAMVNVETHNWLIYKVKLAECSVVSYQTKTQETSQKRKQRTGKNCQMGKREQTTEVPPLQKDTLSADGC